MVTFLMTLLADVYQALSTSHAMISLVPAPVMINACSCCADDTHGDDQRLPAPHDEAGIERCVWLS